MKSSGHYNSLGQYVEVSPVDDWWNEGGIRNVIPRLLSRSEGWNRFNSNIENLVNNVYASDPSMVDKNFFSFNDNKDLADVLARGYGNTSDINIATDIATHSIPLLMPIAHLNNYDKSRKVYEATGDFNLAASALASETAKTSITSLLMRGVGKRVVRSPRLSDWARRHIPGRVGEGLGRFLSRPIVPTDARIAFARVPARTRTLLGALGFLTSSAQSKYFEEEALRQSGAAIKTRADSPDVTPGIPTTEGGDLPKIDAGRVGRYVLGGTLALSAAALAAKRLRDRRKRRRSQEGYSYE